MSQGLITRIGLWMDQRWESKATESMVRAQFNSLENAAIKDKLELKDEIRSIGTALADTIKQVSDLREGDSQSKELADLKTRIEKIELYSGMTRKVDPTKPPVVKSAFSM